MSLALIAMPPAKPRWLDRLDGRVLGIEHSADETVCQRRAWQIVRTCLGVPGEGIVRSFGERLERRCSPAGAPRIGVSSLESRHERNSPGPNLGPTDRGVAANL